MSSLSLSLPLFTVVDCQFVGGSNGRIRIHALLSTPSKDLQPAREPRATISRALGMPLVYVRARTRDENPHARTHAGSMIHPGEPWRCPEIRSPTDRPTESSDEREVCSAGFSSLGARRAYQAFFASRGSCGGSGIEVTVGAKVNLGKPDCARSKRREERCEQGASVRTNVRSPDRPFLFGPSRFPDISPYRQHVLGPSLFRRKPFYVSLLRARKRVLTLNSRKLRNLVLHRDQMYKEDTIEFINISKRTFYRSSKNLFHTLVTPATILFFFLSLLSHAYISRRIF